MDPRRILITNGYSWCNKGDAAIAIATLTLLRKQWPQTKITVVSLTPEIDGPHYRRYGAEVTKDFFSDSRLSKNSLTKILKLAKTVLQVGVSIISYRVGVDIRNILPADKYEILRKYLEAELIISSGGGFLNDSYGSIFLLQLFQIFVSVSLKKPTIICAQSIGPMKGRIHKFIVRMILSKADLITVREKLSKVLLAKMKVAAPVYVTADMTFSLDQPAKACSNRLLSGKAPPIVGITVQKWVYPGSSSPSKEYENYVKVLASFIDHFTEEKNATIFLIPQVIGPKEDDDREAARDVSQWVKHKEKIVVLESDCSPFEIIHLIGQMDLFVGTRMHSNIFSLMSSVPTVAVSYQPKTDGIMKMLGLEEWVIPIEELTFQRLVKKADKAWNERVRLKHEIARALKPVKKLALLNVQLIKRVWEEKSASMGPRTRKDGIL
jgi:colanic acid/amylovoran biosynthesis protein